MKTQAKRRKGNLVSKNKFDYFFTYGCSAVDKKRRDGKLTPVNIFQGIMPSNEIIKRIKRIGSIRKKRERWNHFFKNPQKRYDLLVSRSKKEEKDKVLDFEEKISEIRMEVYSMQVTLENKKAELHDLKWELRIVSENEGSLLNEQELDKKLRQLSNSIIKLERFIGTQGDVLIKKIIIAERKIAKLKSQKASFKTKQRGKLRLKSPRSDWFDRKSMPKKTSPVICDSGCSCKKNVSLGLKLVYSSEIPFLSEEFLGSEECGEEFLGNYSGVVSGVFHSAIK